MIRSIALIFLMTPLALHAQNRSARVSTHILTFAPTSLPETFQPSYQAGGNIELFTASVGTLGLPSPYNGPRDLALYGSKADAEAAAGGKNSIQPIATVTLPEKSDLALIICTRTAGDKVSLAAYNVDSRDLKSGDYRIFNFSKSTISITIGEQKLELAPDNDSILRDAKWHNEAIALPIKIATVTDGKSRPVYSSLREHSPRNRTLMFLFDGSHPSRPITFTTFNAEEAAANTGSGKRPPNRPKP